MKRKKPPARGKPGEPVIAAAGREEASRRHIASAGAVHDAMVAIAADVEKHNGVYPFNRGKITKQEILRRAKKNAAYLEKKTDRIVALKRDVDTWVAEINGKILRGAKTIRRAVTDRVDEACDEVKAIRQAWAEAELEFAEADKTIETLKQENAALHRRLSDGKVVALRRDRPKWNPRSVVPGILDKLEPHLETLELAWSAQPEQHREPTLPSTTDGKINVRQLVRDLGLRETLEQHFFRKPELAGPVNALARVQGLKTIGSRMLDDVSDEGVRRRLKQSADDRSDLRKALAEREALVESLRAENSRLKARLRLVEETGMIMRGGDT